jgi:AbrB family looped-hinge helix DNA binding protein
MTIAQATIKGQVVIPADLRRKYHIHKGTRLAVLDREGEIIFKPLLSDPIHQGLGIVKGGRSALKELLRDRTLEAKR